MAGEYRVRGVRGATTVDANTEDAILEATRVLLARMIAANSIEEEDVASVLFTLTPDLNAAFPAKAARDLGWRQVALLGSTETDVPNSIARCVRVLIHWNTTRPLADVVHVYMRDAVRLRADLYPDNKLTYNGEDHS